MFYSILTTTKNVLIKNISKKKRREEKFNSNKLKWSKNRKMLMERFIKNTL